MIKVDLLAELLLVTLAVPVNLYLVFYLLRPWWLTPQGRALIIKAAGNAWLVDMGLSLLVWGDYPGRDIVRAVGFALFAIGNWYLFVALLRSDKDGRYPPGSWVRRWRRPR